MAAPLRFRSRLHVLRTLVFLLAVALPFSLWFSFALSPLQKQYLPTYTALAMAQGKGRPILVRWIWKTGPKRKPELAGDAEVVFAPFTSPSSLPLALSPEARAKGWTGLLRATQMDDARGEEAVLRDEFFAGQSIPRMMVTPLCGVALSLLLCLGVRGRLGGQSSHEERHGRRTRGPELVSAFGWSRLVRANGIRLRLESKLGRFGPSFRIPRQLEASHVLLMGDTGSGKSNAIRQILRQVEGRGETAIVYDPAGEFVEEFYRPERGDFILNPLDERCPFWHLQRELTDHGIEDANRIGPQAPALTEARTRTETIERHPELNRTQQAAAAQIFESREKIVGLDGVAGAGKTTTLAFIREGVEANGYNVEGFAPTSRAAQKLAEAGIETSTLQAHLAKGQAADTGEKRLYVLDESSLASTRQMHDFVSRLHPNDRVLLVGDTRQHEAVEAGRPFAQLQEAGMKTVKLDEIVRQRNPELKQVVEQLARGQVGEAIGGLERQGRVHEVKDPAERIQAIAAEYARSPGNTLIVSPDNRSRAEINARVHEELQARGIVGREEYRIDALVPRQDLTGADRTWAARYQFNDVIRYSRSSNETGIEKGEYARVKSVDTANNLLTVVRIDKQGQTHETTYDPRRQQGVSIYREQEKAFSVGDRIQFTAPANDLKVANRELGTIESITDDGRMNLKMDGGRSVEIDPKQHPHLDHGYAVTSHSSQGQTAERVLIHVDTDLAAKDLLNNRMAYVAVSRGAHDAQIFTSDREKLPQALGRDVSHQSAHVPEVELRGIGQQSSVVESRQKTYTSAEQEWHYAPMREELEPEDAAQFRWKAETGTVQTYQHTETGRNIHIDGKSGQFYSQDGKPTSQEAALDRAMPKGREHSQEQHENSLGLGR